MHLRTMTVEEFTALAHYVQRIFFIDYREVRVEFLLDTPMGGHYLCRWRDTDEVWLASALEVLVHFDDNDQPIRDFIEYD